MRLYCIQHGLRDRHSHFLQESEGIAEACAARGLALRLYAHRRLDPALAAALDARPAFRHAAATALDTDPVTGPLADYIAMSAAFAADCAVLAADGLGAGDLVLLPYAEAWSLHGLAQFLATLPPDRRPRVAVHFVIPERGWTLDASRTRFGGEASFIRHAAGLLERESAGLVLAAVASQLVAMIAALAAHPCRQVPIPMRYPSPAALDRLRLEARHPPVDLCLAGQYRREKGGALIPALLRGLPHGTRVAVQVNDADGADSLIESLGPASESLELFLQAGECGREDWYARMLASRLMILPYDIETYAARSSGVLAEAAACGVPVVVPAGTWLGDQVESGRAAGVVFRRHDADSILAAIAAGLERQSELAELAARRAGYCLVTQTVGGWVAAMVEA